MANVTIKTVEAGEFWENEDDFLTDLLTMSVFTDEKKFVRSVRKPNVSVAKIPMQKSIYDFDSSSDEELSEAAKAIELEKERKKNIPMGRGYVIQKYQQRRVGGCSPSVLEETERSIREIYPLGFSNEVIEAMYKNPSPPKIVPEQMAALRFRPASSSSSSSGKKTVVIEDDSASNSSVHSYKPAYVTDKPNLKDLNEFPKL